MANWCLNRCLTAQPVAALAAQGLALEGGVPSSLPCLLTVPALNRRWTDTERLQKLSAGCILPHGVTQSERQQAACQRHATTKPRVAAQCGAALGRVTPPVTHPVRVPQCNLARRWPAMCAGGSSGLGHVPMDGYEKIRPTCGVRFHRFPGWHSTSMRFDAFSRISVILV